MLSRSKDQFSTDFEFVIWYLQARQPTTGFIGTIELSCKIWHVRRRWSRMRHARNEQEAIMNHRSGQVCRYTDHVPKDSRLLTSEAWRLAARDGTLGICGCHTMTDERGFRKRIRRWIFLQANFQQHLQDDRRPCKTETGCVVLCVLRAVRPDIRSNAAGQIHACNKQALVRGC